MNDMNPTYASEDGVHYAIVAGKVIASGPDFEVVEREAKEALVAVPSPETEDTKTSATHIVTPNGVKGQILSRTAGLWVDEVTVRFDNGQIHSVPVTPRTTFTTENHKVAASKPVDRLRTELSKIASSHNRKSLTDRLMVVGKIKNEAHMLITGGVSNDDLRELHELVLTAEHEITELKDGIEHVDATEGEAYQPYQPETQVIDGASVGHQNDGTWLDATLNDMIEEARGTDFEQLLDDGPTLLTAEQDDTTITDGGAVREMALSFVRSKTAGLEGVEVEKFEQLFVARCEDARRVELANRKATTSKEAAQRKSNVDDAPVESLFM